MNAQDNKDQEKELPAAEEETREEPSLPIEDYSAKETEEETAQATAEEIEQPEEEAPEEAPKEESKARRFFRLALRWVLGVLIVYGLGYLTAIFALYRPTTQELGQTRGELEAARDQINSLEARVEELKPLEAENEELLAAQDEYELHIAILNARLDVAMARLALAQDDIAKAQITLRNTDETLAKIKTLFPEAQSEIVTAMEDRLELTLSEIEDDPYAAQSDLDVLATNLLQLEDSLFSSP
jgi:hypothetical protein